LKEEALDRTLWRTRFGRGYGPVVRQNTEWMNELPLDFKRLVVQHKILMHLE
jgi:transposase InsO family protein